LGVRTAGAAALAVCVGFWGQLILDIRAFSQINSIPVLLLAGLSVSNIEEEPLSKKPAGWFFFGLTAAALLVLYCEAVPFFCLGLALFSLSRLFQGKTSMGRCLAYAGTFLLSTILMWPVAPYLNGFFLGQLHLASSSVNDWHKAYFSWLYGNPIVGLWGFSTLAGDPRLGWLLKRAMQVVFVPMGMLMTVQAGRWLAGSLSRRDGRVSSDLAAAFTWASLAQFLLLAFRRQWWAAAKGLSFGYAYLMIGVSAFSLTKGNMGSRLDRCSRLAAGLWLAVQVGLGLQRVVYASAGIDYGKYVLNHGVYRHHRWDLSALSPIFAANRGSTVLMCLSDPWLEEYVSYVFGWDVVLSPVAESERIGPAKISGKPQYVLAHADAVGSRVLARTEELALIPFDEKTLPPQLVGVDNPNGTESADQGLSSFWMGGKPTHLTVYAARAGWAVMEGRFVPGPSLPEKAERRVLLRSDADGQDRESVVREGAGRFRFPVHPGLNRLEWRVADAPSVQLLAGGDRRPLLLRATLLRLRFDDVSERK
jgi:hypothetical protein